MDAFTDPRVEEIIFQGPTQVGKTEALLNMLGYVADQDPGPALWVDSTGPEAMDFCVERIIPMFMKSPSLIRHLTNNSDDITKRGIKLDRMKIKIAWATSPATLASRAIRYLLLNEVNKYPMFSGREADPIKLAKERTRTYHNRKIVLCSTPTTPDGYITREYEMTDKRKYYVPCPHCKHYQIFVWAQIKFPKEERNPEVIRAKKLAHYECIKCKGKITDVMKPKMLLAGSWVPEGFDPKEAAGIKFPVFAKVGFWINAIYSPFLTFSDIAAEWLSSYHDRALHMNFVNSWLAEPYTEDMGRNKESEIRALARPYPKEKVPAEALALTGIVDVQKDHFYITLRAWGYHSKSWGILHTSVETWGEVEKVLLKSDYPCEDPNKPKYPVSMVLIDSGDGKRTGEVYEFCSKWRDVCRPIKGRDHLNGVPFRSSKIEFYPDGRPLTGGMLLWTLDTTYFKDKLSRLIKNTKQDSIGGWFIHKDPSQEYVTQMCSEHNSIVYDRRTKKARMEWTLVPGHRANHFWDCEVYGVAAAEMLRIFYLQPEEEQRKPTDQQEEDKPKTSWVNKRSGWMNRNG